MTYYSCHSSYNGVFWLLRLLRYGSKAASCSRTPCFTRSRSYTSPCWIVMAHGWSGIAHVRLFSFQGTKKSNDTLLPWSVVSLLFVIYFVVILFVDLWRTRYALVCLSTLILYYNRTFVSIEKYKILRLLLIIFFRNHNMLCFYLCAIVAMLFPLYTPSKKPFAKDSNYWSSEPFWMIF